VYAAAAAAAAAAAVVAAAPADDAPWLPDAGELPVIESRPTTGTTPAPDVIASLSEKTELAEFMAAAKTAFLTLKEARMRLVYPANQAIAADKCSPRQSQMRLLQIAAMSMCVLDGLLCYLAVASIVHPETIAQGLICLLLSIALLLPLCVRGGMLLALATKKGRNDLRSCLDALDSASCPNDERS